MNNRTVEIKVRLDRKEAENLSKRVKSPQPPVQLHHDPGRKKPKPKVR